MATTTPHHIWTVPYACETCGQVEYESKKGRPSRWCEPCKRDKERQRLIEYRKRTRPDYMSIPDRMAWREANPEQYAEQERVKKRSRYLRDRYQMTVAEYEALVRAQSGRCLICTEESELVVDHDHACCPGQKACGKCVRGLLCNPCNQGVGLLKDDPEILKRASAYIEAAPRITRAVPSVCSSPAQ